MSEVTLHVLYPQPTDVEQFDRDYLEHLALFHRRMQVPQHARPYTVTRFVDLPRGAAAYYQMFAMPFASAEALQRALGSVEMQEVAADAVRISSGGAPLILIGAASI